MAHRPFGQGDDATTITLIGSGHGVQKDIPHPQDYRTIGQSYSLKHLCVDYSGPTEGLGLGF